MMRGEGKPYHGGEMPKEPAAVKPVREVSRQQEEPNTPRDPAMIADPEERDRVYAEHHDLSPPSLAHIRAKMAAHRLARGEGVPAKRPAATEFLPASWRDHRMLPVRGGVAKDRDAERAYAKAGAIGRDEPEQSQPRGRDRRAERSEGVRPVRTSGGRR